MIILVAERVLAGRTLRCAMLFVLYILLTCMEQKSRILYLSDIGLIMYPELLVRAVRCACLELLAENLKDQGLLRIFTFLDK
jgi:hypothetical protein